MKITLGWLKENCACSDGVEWFKGQDKTLLLDVINSLMKEDKFNWANWTIVRFMTYKQKVQYAVFAAEQVIKIFEKKYPEDDRPRKAIEAAKKWIEDPSEENKAAAKAAANAANAAANAANAAANAAAYAANAAAYATNAANAAANAANAAAYATNAANVANAAANVAAMKKKILKYGLKLLGLG